MSITTLSSREFNQRTSEAKHATRAGPVIITERGRPSHVLLTYEAYQALNGRNDRNILDLLACPKAAEIDFEIPMANLGSRDADFS